MTTLDGGLRLVHISAPASRAGIFGIAVRAGSADEAPEQYGLAHFVEHTIFKGTAHRSSWNIINRMEAVGGELNAYTTKEETVVYSIFPTGSESRAAELIADLAINSRFPARELEKEREVVVDEIYSYLDTPSEAIYDDFEEYAFAGSPLAHNILGSADSVRRLSSDDCRRFLAENYTRANIVVFYSGPATLSRVASIVSRYFAAMPAGVPKPPADPIISGAPFEHTRQLDIHQCHVLLGAHTGGILAPDYTANLLFSNILGGPGMNSMLNVELRERAGLVYNAEATTAMFANSGLITVYFGCDADDLGKCLRRYRRTVAALADGGMTPRRLDAAKKQYLGQLAISSENRENRIMAAARATLLCGAPVPPAQTIEAINAVTTDDISRIATTMLDASSLIFKPV